MFDQKKAARKLRGKLRRGYRDIAWYIGGDSPFIREARGARVLVYHGLCRKLPLSYNTLFITMSRFEAQLKLYKTYFNLISLDELYQRKFSNDRFNICLTFDDGFANNYKYVLPLLEKYKVPAAFFITGIRDAGYDILWNDVLCVANRFGPERVFLMNTEFRKAKSQVYASVATGETLASVLRRCGFEEKKEMIEQLGGYRYKADKDFWLQADREEIRELSASEWVTIGSHGYYHNDMGNITGNLLKEEMIKSKHFLEELTGKDIRALAFPYGSYSKEALTEAKKAGYSQLLGTELVLPGDKEEETLKERLTINPFISNVNQLHANIKGHYE